MRAGGTQKSSDAMKKNLLKFIITEKINQRDLVWYLHKDNKPRSCHSEIWNNSIEINLNYARVTTQCDLIKSRTVKAFGGKKSTDYKTAFYFFFPSWFFPFLLEEISKLELFK